MKLLKELKGRGFNIISTTPSFMCTVFEDNNGVLEIANAPEMRPCIKHIIEEEEEGVFVSGGLLLLGDRRRSGVSLSLSLSLVFFLLG